MHILSYENEFCLHVDENSFEHERLSTKTRFEKEAQDNAIRKWPINGTSMRKTPHSEEFWTRRCNREVIKIA